MTKTEVTDLLIATTNAGKIKEIKGALQDLPLRFRLLSEFDGFHAVSEAGATYEENAVRKALDYSRQSGLYALADDSGLEVDALAGHLGIHSARYGGIELSDGLRIEKLLSELKGLKTSNRSAQFICVMVLAAPAVASRQEATVLAITRGVCSGRIARSLRGSYGFGYDPLFVPTGYEETFGQLSASIKNLISHRAQALLLMRRFIESWMVNLTV